MASLREADFPVALRGYERQAVDAYVERVRDFVEEVMSTRSPQAAVKRALEQVGEETGAILQHANETAEEITARSRSKADDRLQRAEREAKAMREVAESRVRDLDTEIDNLWAERQRLVADMQRIARELEQLATAAAQRFPPEETKEERVAEVGPAAGAEGAAEDATHELPSPPPGPPGERRQDS